MYQQISTWLQPWQSYHEKKIFGHAGEMEAAKPEQTVVAEMHTKQLQNVSDSNKPSQLHKSSCPTLCRWHKMCGSYILLDS